MIKKLFIIPGWEANPTANWFPWLKKELEKKGYSVEVPEMPDTMKPTLKSWVNHLKKIIGAPDENTYLVGHSLGVITILRYLEGLKSERIGGAIFVAGFPEKISYQELDSFFQKPLDYKKIKNIANKFIAIHSDNDPFVTIRNGELLRDNLDAEMIIISNAGHLNAEDRYFKLPIVLDKILEITKL